MNEDLARTVNIIVTMALAAADAQHDADQATLIETLDAFLEDPASLQDGAPARKHKQTLEQAALEVLDHKVIDGMNDNHRHNNLPFDAPERGKPRTNPVDRLWAATKIVEASFARVRRSAIGAPGF